MESNSTEATSDFLLTPPLPLLKIQLNEDEAAKENIAIALPKHDRPDALNISPSSLFVSDDFLKKDDHEGDELSAPKYFSTPKLETSYMRKFVRNNSQPVRRINFTLTESQQTGSAFRTPVLEFTKLKNAITPDSGFSTPAAEGLDSLSSPPILSVCADSYLDGCEQATPSAPDKEAPSSKQLPSAPNYSRSVSAEWKHHFSDDSVSEKQLHLPSWLSNFYKTCPNPLSSSTPSSTPSTVQKKPRPSILASAQSQNTPLAQDCSLPGILSMQRLTPIPVIMAPTLSRFELQEKPSNSQAKPQKRKPLEELPQNTQTTQQSEDERPNHSYMDLIKMALESAPEGQMTLKEIIAWIEDHFPYFKLKAKQTWKNSIRHNLSLHHDFTKVEEKKHGGKWKLAADAKKYAHRIPKPPVVKPPPKPPPMVCVKKRKSGLQPILPKTMPYALFPIALAPLDCQGIATENSVETTSQAEQPQRPHCHQEPDPNEHQPHLQEKQQNVALGYLEKQPCESHHQSSQEQQQQQQQQQQPPPPQQQQAHEVKLHFHLTQEQRQLLQQQRKSLLGSASSKSQGSASHSVGRHSSKFQPSNSITQNFPLLHMSSFRKNLNVTNRDTSARLPLIAPKPSPLPTYQSFPLAGQSADSSKFADNGLGQLPTKSNSKHGQESVPKNRNICRILDRMPKSKSFDVASKRKPMLKNVTKSISKSTSSKAGAAQAMAAAVSEDMQAAEEINKILQQGDEQTTESTVHVGKSFEQKFIWQDELRSESEPGRDLLLQAWEETMSPLIWDEDSQSSCLSSGVEDSHGYIPLQFVNSRGLNSIPTTPASSSQKENVFGFELKSTHKRIEIGEEMSSAQKNLPSSLQRIFPSNVGINSLLNDENNLVNHSCSLEITTSSTSSFQNNKVVASARSGTNRTSCSESLPSVPEQADQCNSTVASATPQRKPGLYRTKSRRKQIHVPLQIDLSPKRETAVAAQPEQALPPVKICSSDSDQREISVKQIESEQSNLLQNIRPSTKDNLSQDTLLANGSEKEGVSIKTNGIDHAVPGELFVSIPISDAACFNTSQAFHQPNQESGFAHTGGNLNFFPGMDDIYTESSGALDLSPSRGSVYQQNLVLQPAFSDLDRDIPKQACDQELLQNAEPEPSLNLSSPHFLDTDISFGFTGNYYTPSRSSSDFVPSQPKPEVIPEMTKESNLRDWRDDASIHIAPGTNTPAATAGDALPHFLSLCNKSTPFGGVSDTLIQSISSEMPGFAAEYRIPESLNHQIPSMTGEEHASVKELSKPDSLFSRSNLPLDDQNYQSLDLEVHSFPPRSQSSYSHNFNSDVSVGTANRCESYVFNPGVLQSSGKDCLSQTFSTISNYHQERDWTFEPGENSSNSLPSSNSAIMNFTTYASTTTNNNPIISNDTIFPQHDEGGHDFVDNFFAFPQQTIAPIQQHQGGCPNSGAISTSSPSYVLENPVLLQVQQLQVNQQSSCLSSGVEDNQEYTPLGFINSQALNSTPTRPTSGREISSHTGVDIAVLPPVDIDIPGSEDVGGSPQLSPVGEEEEVIDAAGSDSSFLNSSVFDNIESNFLLKE